MLIDHKKIQEINSIKIFFLKVCGMVLCCGQDGYRTKVPQHPKDTYHTYDHTRDSFINNEIKYIESWVESEVASFLFLVLFGALYNPYLT